MRTATWRRWRSTPASSRGLRGRTDVEKRLIEITGEDEDTNSFVSVDHWSYLANVHSQEALEPEPDDKVAVIVATGEIVPG